MCEGFVLINKLIISYYKPTYMFFQLPFYLEWVEQLVIFIFFSFGMIEFFDLDLEG